MTDVQVTIELGHRASPRPKPTKEGFTHDWTVFVRGPEQYNIANFVEKVVFHLHATFENPKRECKEPPYHVAEHGYAGFELPVVIYFKNKAEPRRIEFMYNLFLHMQETVTNSRYEKLTFQNPTEEFKKKLLKAGGVLMIPPEEVQFTSLFGPPIKTMDSPKKSKPSSSSVGFKDKPARPSLDENTKPQSGKSKDKDNSSSKSSSSTGKSENNRDDGHREKSSKEKHSSSRKHTESPVLTSSSSKRHSESPNRHDSSSKKLKRSSSSSSFIDKKSKEKDRDIERDKEKQKELVREKEREKEKERERDKEKERERDKEKERERQKELEKERQREAERERQREMEEREREKERERERLKEIEKGKQKEREKLKLKEKEREKLRQKDKEREIEQEKLKEKEREKLKLKDKEREIEQEKMKDKDREKEKLRRKEKREKEKSSSNVTSEKHSKRKHSNSEKQKVREKENIENEPYKDSQKKPSVDSELKKRSENEREKSKGNIPSKSDSPSNSSSSRKDGCRKHEKTVPIPVKSPHKTKESNVEKTNKHSHREEKHKDKLDGKVLSHQKRTSNTQKSKPKKHVDGATSHRRKQLSKITSRELIDDLSLSDSSDSSSVSSLSSSVSGISSSSSDIGDSEVENAASVSRKSSTSSSKSAESTPTQKSALGTLIAEAELDEDESEDDIAAPNSVFSTHSTGSRSSPGHPQTDSKSVFSNHSGDSRPSPSRKQTEPKSIFSNSSSKSSPSRQQIECKVTQKEKRRGNDKTENNGRHKKASRNSFQDVGNVHSNTGVIKHSEVTKLVHSESKGFDLTCKLGDSSPSSVKSTNIGDEAPAEMLDSPNGEDLKELVALQRRLMSIKDPDVLVRVVMLIQEVGKFQIGDSTFDFDLCSLDSSTVQEIRRYLNHI